MDEGRTKLSLCRQTLVLSRPDVTLQSPAEPLEGSANREPCRQMTPATTNRLTSFLQLTFPIMPPQSESVFTVWVEEATREQREVRGREETTQHENTVEHWSQLGLFQSSPYFSVSFEYKMTNSGLLQEWAWVLGWNIQGWIYEETDTKMHFEYSSTILAQASATSQGLRKWLTLLRYQMMSVLVCVGRPAGGSWVWAANLWTLILRLSLKVGSSPSDLEIEFQWFWCSLPTTTASQTV